MDSFICGSCTAVFHDIGEFLEHKKICIATSVGKANETVEMQQRASVEATVLDADGKSTTFIIINADIDNEVSSSSGLKDTDVNVNQLQSQSSGLQQNIAMQIMSSESGILFY